MQQGQEVPKVLVQGAQETAGKENIRTKGNGPPVSCASRVFGSILSGVNNSTINISPQN